MKRELKEILTKLETQGWKVMKGKRSSHYRLLAPGGGLYFTGSTPSDNRAIMNLRSDLRRLGANL